MRREVSPGWPCGPEALAALFDREFLASEHTRLRGGAAEPLYCPAFGAAPATIYFRWDYAASALHEVAHWCLAGRRRRQRVDYGYWYAPEGRDAAQQAAFFRVEAAPQALESIFCEALGVPFSPSVDNPGQPLPDLAPFLEALAAQRARWEQGGLPPRAARFRDALRGLVRL